MSVKQRNYILYLLGRAGFDTRYVNSKYKALGLTMRERQGTVSDWLDNLPEHQVPATIRRLQGLVQ